MVLRSHHVCRCREIASPASHFSRDCTGATAVEFALIAPAMLWLVMGIIEVSLVLFAQTVLESAAFNASRTGRTGYVITDSTREQTIRAVLEKRASHLMDAQKLTVESSVYARFDQIGQPEPFTDANGNGIRDEGENFTDINGNGQYDEDMGVAGLGSAGEIVVYTLHYPWPITTPMIANLLGTGNHFDLTARAIVQNEPY